MIKFRNLRAPLSNFPLSSIEAMFKVFALAMEVVAVTIGAINGLECQFRARE